MLTDAELQLVQSKIKHVFVLVMENRSFDHMLGFSQIKGTIANSNQPGSIEGIDPAHVPSNPDLQGNPVSSSTGAPNTLTLPDPGHDFFDVMVQLTGNKSWIDPEFQNNFSGSYPENLNNAGFVIDYQSQQRPPGDISLSMKAFAPERVPIITQLAKEFVVCDHWFSSMPGPTWPNRFFLHAATSGGLDDSPSLTQILLADTIKGFKFENGTIFDSLSEQRINWAIYAGNKFPHILSLKGIRSNDVIAYDLLEADLSKPGFPAYTFIEPNYGHFLLGNYKDGNSQHPLDDVSSGEKLIKEVYENIRKSPVWNESLLIITYDEHGGFYDHVIPPSAEAPGDQGLYGKHGFDFKQYGVRVPALIISPWIPKNLIDKRIYDHSSILASLEKLFGLGNLTARDQSANDFLDLISLPSPRDTPLKLGEPVAMAAPDPVAEANPLHEEDALDSSLTGFLHIAYIRDLEVSSPAERSGLPEKLQELNTRGKALSYMQAVKPKVQD